MVIDLIFLKPQIMLTPFQIFNICQILDVKLPLMDEQIKGILKMIEIYENNYQAINFIANPENRK